MIFSLCFTPEYSQLAQQCAASVIACGGTVIAESYPSKGDWRANTLLKLEHLRRMFAAFPGKDVWLLDADSEMLAMPDKPAGVYDVAMRWTGWPDRPGHGVNHPERGWGRWHAGSVVFPAPSRRGMIVARAVQIAQNSPSRSAPEETALCRAIIELDAVCADLPPSACWFEKKSPPRGTTIVQKNLSGEMKKVVGASKV